MFSDLCVDDPDRVIDIDDKKKEKKNDGEFDDEEGEDDEFEYINTSDLMANWDNDDPKVCDDDEKCDEKNQRLLKNLNAYMVPIIIIRQ